MQNTEWTPIGTYNYPFKGNFDGSGKTIRNMRIETTRDLSSYGVETYGFFGSIGGGNSRQKIQNLQLQNVNININKVGRTTTSNYERTFGINIGSLSGTMYKNVDVENVNILDFNIQETNQFRINTHWFQYIQGGIIGEIVNGPYNTGRIWQANESKITNSVASGNINIYTAGANYTRTKQYSTGGIIGRITNESVYPDNCVYRGNIITRGTTGPIFGSLKGRSNVGYTDHDEYWQGNELGNLNCTSRYFGYRVNNRSFNTSIKSGTSDARISYSTTNYGYTQGVNKGIYNNSINNNVQLLNQNQASNHVKWKVENNKFKLIPRQNTQVDETTFYTFVANVSDEYNDDGYTYHWYINENQRQDSGNIFVVTEPDFAHERQGTIVVKDRDGYFSLHRFKIEKISIDIKFKAMGNNAVKANIEGNALHFTQYKDFEFEWFKEDISGFNYEKIDGATLDVLGNLDKKFDYIVKVKNNKYSELNREKTYMYANRTVIYVDPFNGSNYNDGYAERRAVRDFDTAYGKLKANATRDENVIVLMAEYEREDLFSEENNTIYKKNATITGTYKKRQFNPVLHFEGNDTYRYMNGDTTFMYITFDGGKSSNWWGSSPSQVYWYLQGHSLTMGEQVRMQNYARANTNQGLIRGNAPAFHIFAAWHKYDQARLPRNNSKILIKSGTYGRIVLGGSPGTNAVSNLVNYNSRNFTGSSLSDMFNVEATIDIENSTTPNQYEYDVNLFVGGAACGNTYAKIVENIKSGKVGRVLGASIGDTSNRPDDWNYPINTFLGSTTINITGGEITELYGGALGRNMSALSGNSYLICDSYFYGTVDINISGGKILGNIYGAGAGGVSGYNVNSSDRFKRYGKDFKTSINMNISGGEVHGNIYGGGYGYTNYLTENTTAFDGGALYGDSNIVITNSPKIIGDIYGGGCGYNLRTKPNIAVMEGKSKIDIKGTPEIQGKVYGAGAGVSGYDNMAKLTGDTLIQISTNVSNEYFGGGNIAQLKGKSTIKINEGNITGNIYGGGNIGIVDGETNVHMLGGKANAIYGGGYKAKAIKTNVYLNAGEVSNVYGGGNAADVDEVNIFLKGSDIGRIIGGSNLQGRVKKTNIDAKLGKAESVYGGNNKGGYLEQSEILLDGAEIKNVYGGGNEANAGTTNITLKKGKIENIYGGGNSADANITNILLTSGTVLGNIFGGSNNLGIVNTSNIEINDGKYINIFGGNNAGGMTRTSNVHLNKGEVENIYGGGNKTNAGTTNIDTNGGKVKANIFGGSNLVGDVENTNIVVNLGDIKTVYGGNNAGGITRNPKIEIKGGNVETVYGGGNQAKVIKTNVKIENGTIKDVYGGGNAAEVDENTNLNISGGKVLVNVYGGGNEGKVNDSTFVNIVNGEILGSVYAGGNGATATVYKNTNINVSGKTKVGNDTSIAPHQGSVFGGGKAATTGSENTNNSQARVNIAGGQIYGNVYRWCKYFNRIW